jgi:hypothetical protein
MFALLVSAGGAELFFWVQWVPLWEPPVLLQTFTAVLQAYANLVLSATAN